MENIDLTFITNEKNQSLKERFEVLIKDTKFFDCLVGYFYTSGFHAIYKSLEKTDKIRIILGISTSRQTYDLLKMATQDHQPSLQFSHAETKQNIEGLVEREMEDSEDNQKVEEGVVKFIEWIRSKKLEIRAYPSQNIHAKLYIMTFAEGDRDTGRVITGSSNFTQAGLVDNLEFNVELKNRADYEFARQKFEELWKKSVDVSEKYIQTIEEKTWLNQNITPYQLYLKFLYEYFKDELSHTDEVFIKYLPEEFKKLEYQEQAVLNAKKILEEYGGVFVSDVVGLGKTYISAMLAGQLDGRTLVIAPPMLLDKTNPGSWTNVFSDFRVPADFESIGKLDDIIDRGTEKYTNVIIEGKAIDLYTIKQFKYLEWDTKRVPGQLRRQTFPELYDRPKIMRGRVTGGIYDESGLLCNDSIVVFVRFTDIRGVNNKSIQTSIKKFNPLPRPQLEKISEKFDLKYLLAILNSSFAFKYLNNIRRHRLENYFYPDDFRRLPIADISPKEQKPFVDLVDKILAITKDDDYLQNLAKQAKVREYEKQIVQLVYKLYGLTEEEIRIVEGERIKL